MPALKRSLKQAARPLSQTRGLGKADFTFQTGASHLSASAEFDRASEILVAVMVRESDFRLTRYAPSSVHTWPTQVMGVHVRLVSTFVCNGGKE